MATNPSAELPSVEATVRARLRALRQSAGWSLDDVAERSHLSASTISRIETGRRTISLDVLVPLAGALQTDLNALLDVTGDDDDIVIRPIAATGDHATIWPLTRPNNRTIAIKMRLEPRADEPEAQVHPGHDWMFVISGRVLLTLGARQLVVAAGEAAEFSTMTPHSVAALRRPAELIMVFDRDGERAHLHHDH